MAFQVETGAGSARAMSNRDFVTKAVGFFTSQHVASVLPNAAGTGFVVGDVLTLTHAGALLNAKFEVTAIGGGGAITGLVCRCSGAFSNRVAIAAVNVGGAGYAVNDVVEIEGGTSREKAKAQVTAVAAGVVTSLAVFETGGAYSVAPGLVGATTAGIGPSGFGGDNALTVDLTMTGLVGTVGLVVTGGTGTGATVNITLAETGASVDTKNRNDRVWNGLNDEKEVVLRLDATGFTNKPYIGIRTGTETVGIDTRYFASFHGFTAHNPAFNFADQVNDSPGLTSGDAHNDDGSYLIFPQNMDRQVDFWIGADTLTVFGTINVNPTPVTDDGRYLFFNIGFGDRVKTETEDPFPSMVFASSRDRDASPVVGSSSITSPAEARAPNNGPFWYYRVEDSQWTQIKNNDTGAVGPRTDIAWPFGELFVQVTASSPEKATIISTVEWSEVSFKRDRTAPDRIILMLPGTTPKHALFPIFVQRKVLADASTITDSTRFTVRHMRCLFNSDSAGAQIVNFSEDIVDADDGRWFVFHNYDLTARYQYIAVKELV